METWSPPFLPQPAEEGAYRDCPLEVFDKITRKDDVRGYLPNISCQDSFQTPHPPYSKYIRSRLESDGRQERR